MHYAIENLQRADLIRIITSLCGTCRGSTSRKGLGESVWQRFGELHVVTKAKGRLRMANARVRRGVNIQMTGIGSATPVLRAERPTRSLHEMHSERGRRDRDTIA